MSKDIFNQIKSMAAYTSLATAVAILAAEGNPDQNKNNSDNQNQSVQTDLYAGLNQSFYIPEGWENLINPGNGPLYRWFDRTVNIERAELKLHVWSEDKPLISYVKEAGGVRARNLPDWNYGRIVEPTLEYDRRILSHEVIERYIRGDFRERWIVVRENPMIFFPQQIKDWEIIRMTNENEDKKSFGIFLT